MPASQPEALSRSGSPEASPFRRAAAEGPESREVWLAPPRAETGGQDLGTRALAAEAWAAGPVARAQAAPPWRAAAAAPAAAGTPWRARAPSGQAARPSARGREARRPSAAAPARAGGPDCRAEASPRACLGRWQ